MPPVRTKSKTAKRPARAKRTATKAKTGARKGPRTGASARKGPGAKKVGAKGRAKAAKPVAGARRRCVALDPFGDPCQSAPRPGSTHCTIHSYLDR